LDFVSCGAWYTSAAGNPETLAGQRCTYYATTTFGGAAASGSIETVFGASYNPCNGGGVSVPNGNTTMAFAHSPVPSAAGAIEPSTTSTTVILPSAGNFLNLLGVSLQGLGMQASNASKALPDPLEQGEALVYTGQLNAAGLASNAAGVLARIACTGH
jgi:hypothetical protein